MLEHTISDQSNDQVPEQLNLQSYSYNDASQDHADLYDPEDPRAAEDDTNLQIVINSAVNELNEFEQESVKSIKFDVEYDAGDKVIKIDEETEETSSSWESFDEKESDGMDYIYMVIAILFIGGLVGIYLGCKKSSTNKVKENVDRKETIKLPETIKLTVKTDLNDVNIKTDTELYDSIKKQEKQVNKMESKVETKIKQAELKVVKNEMKENKTEMKSNKTALKVTEKNTLKSKKNEEQKEGSKKEESKKEGIKKEGSEKEGSEKEGKCQKAFKIWFGLFSVFTFFLGLAEIIHYVYTWNKGSKDPSVFTPNAAVYVHGICSIITVIIFVVYIIKFGCPKKWQVLHMFFLALLSIAIFVVRLEMSWAGKWTTNKINTVAGIGEITLLVLYILFGIFGIIFVILECCKRN